MTRTVKRMRNKPTKIDPEQIKALIAENKYISNAEIAQRLGVSQSGVREWTKRHPEWGKVNRPNNNSTKCTPENIELVRQNVIEHKGWSVSRIARHIGMKETTVNKIVRLYVPEYEWKGHRNHAAGRRPSDDPAAPYYKPRKKPPEPEIPLNEAVRLARLENKSYGEWSLLNEQNRRAKQDRDG